MPNIKVSRSIETRAVSTATAPRSCWPNSRRRSDGIEGLLSLAFNLGPGEGIRSALGQHQPVSLTRVSPVRSIAAWASGGAWLMTPTGGL